MATSIYSRVMNFVSKTLKEYFPSIALREGTGIWDLIVKGFALIYYRIIDLLEIIRRDNNIYNYQTMSEAALDLAAGNWFLTRQVGGKSSGNVRVYVKTAQAISIPAGSFIVQSSSGLKFINAEAWSFSASQIASNVDGNRYYFDIIVYAEKEGDTYNVSAGAITDVYSSVSFVWTKVYNQYPFTGGARKETNAEFFDRIVNSANTRSLLITKNSVKTVLYEAFPTFTDIEIDGYGDPLMERDFVYYLIYTGGKNPYEKTDFFNKTRGNIISNRNVALEMISPTKLPSPTTWDAIGYELTQEQYEQIAVLDTVTCTKHGSIIFQDSFDETGPVYNSDDWIFSDSGLGWGRRAFGNSITIFNDVLTLGASDNYAIPKIPVI